MQLIECKNCGSNRFLNKDGTLICCACGSKYKLDDTDNITYEELTDRDIPVLIAHAREYHKECDYASEIKTLNSVLEKTEEIASVWVDLGRACREVGLRENALNCYHRAQDLDPTFPTAFSNEGILFLIEGDYKSALVRLKKGLDLISEVDGDYPTILANYALALGFCEGKKRAIPLLKKAERFGYPNADFIKKRLGIKWYEYL